MCVCFLPIAANIDHVHLLAIPMRESRAGLLMFELIIQLLGYLFESPWTNKLLSGATDGAGNMTGILQWDVTGFEQEARPGVFRIWCANHQPDLVIKSVMNTMVKYSLRTPMIRVILLYDAKRNFVRK